MKYFLGIDGGGTKTKIAICDEQEKLIYMNETGPSSIDTVDLAVALENINLALLNFFNDHSNVIFTSVFAGLGGIAFPSDYTVVENLLKSLPGVSKSTIVMARNDMVNALSSGLCFDEGMTLICGTGMVCYGIDKLGGMHKSGGWGFKEGDAGSAYDLGLQALKHTFKAYDGRLPKDDFSEAVAKHIHLTVASEIFELSNTYYDQRTLVAELAPLVTFHAELKNEFALKIVDHATNELVLAVSSVYHHLQLESKKLVIVGSLGNSNGIFKKMLHQKIKMIDPNIQIIKPLIDPAHAAAVLAKHNVN